MKDRGGRRNVCDGAFDLVRGQRDRMQVWIVDFDVRVADSKALICWRRNFSDAGLNDIMMNVTAEG